MPRRLPRAWAGPRRRGLPARAKRPGAGGRSCSAPPARPRLRLREPARPSTHCGQPSRPLRSRDPPRGWTWSRHGRRSNRWRFRGRPAGHRPRRLLPAIPGRQVVDRARAPELTTPGRPGFPVPQGYRPQVSRRCPTLWRRSNRSPDDPARKNGPGWARRVARPGSRWRCPFLWRRPRMLPAPAPLRVAPPIESRLGSGLPLPASIRSRTCVHLAARRRACLGWTREPRCSKRQPPAHGARSWRRCPQGSCELRPRLSAGHVAAMPAGLRR